MGQTVLCARSARVVLPAKRKATHGPAGVIVRRQDLALGLVDALGAVRSISLIVESRQE